MNEVVSPALVPPPGQSRDAPWHFWGVALIGLLWNAIGAYDFAMTQLGDADYLAQLTPEQRDYLTGFPAVMVGFWALGVWGSFVGSLLLLLKSRHAVIAFWLSLLGLTIGIVYRQSGAMPADLQTPATLAMTAVIGAAVLFFLWYSARMRREGVLR